MATMIEPVEAPETSADCMDIVMKILSDPTLTMAEKLLSLEALFAHDSAPEEDRPARRARSAVGP